MSINRRSFDRRRGATRGRRGLTLIEVLIVIALLLALGGIVAVSLLSRKGEADIDLTKAQINQFETALKFFKLDIKRYPTKDEGLTSLWSKQTIQDELASTSWKSPYLETPAPRDMWGNEWVYNQPSEMRDGLPFDIISPGPDGELDTEDDISNHDMVAIGDTSDVVDGFEDFTTADSSN